MATHQYVYVMKGLTKAYTGDRPVIENIWLSFYPGAKIGVLGLNGSGKSTLLRIMAGLDTEFQGEAWSAEGVNVGFLHQEPQLNETKDVLGNVMEGVAETKALLDRFNEVSMRFGEDLSPEEMDALIAEQAKLQDQIEAADAWGLDRYIEIAMDALRCPPGDAVVANLSGGERRRVALCRLLLSNHDMLLLDEPTNHLDADTVHWLETHLQNYKGTIILITHDRYFLDNVVTWMLEIERTQAIPYQGNYSAYLERKVSLLDGEKKQEAARQRRLKTELEWIRTNPKARSTKNKARLRRYEDMRQEQNERSEDAIDLQIPPGKKLGTKVLESRGLSKAYGDNKLFEDLTFEVAPGAIVGVIGENGTGKTTLLRLIMGQETPDAGEVEMGKTVELCYVDQNRLTLEDKNTVYEEITDGLHELPFGQGFINSRAYLARFNFKGEDQQKKVGELSGGQRNRVQLAKLLRHGGNLIMLDEPTNDLDLQTLRVLEEAVASFPGSAIVVSHDRYFLNRVVTHILALEGDGKWRFLLGDYDTYREIREREEGEADGKGTHRRLK